MDELYANRRIMKVIRTCLGTWIRTKIHSSKGCCPTVERSPNGLFESILSKNEYKIYRRVVEP